MKTQPRTPTHFRPSLLALALLCTTPAVMAQESEDFRQESSTWRFTVGLGAAYQPRYPGSDEHKTRAVPVVSAGFGRYFLGGIPDTGIPLGAGVFLIQEQKFRLGLGVGRQIERPRKESDSRNLRGLGDVDRTTLGAVFASYTDDWFAVRGYVVTDLEDNNQGTRVSLDLDGRYRVNNQLLLTAGPGITWADGDYTETFFGVNDRQSRRSGKPRYATSSGVNSVRFGIGANYQIDSQWAVRARFTAISLRGDAEDSPITQKKSQNTFSVFTTYSF